MLDRFVEDLPLDSVVSDDSGGAYQAARHLIETGHKRIGLINLPLSLTTGQSRLKGYKQALEESGLPVDDTLDLHRWTRPTGRLPASQ